MFIHERDRAKLALLTTTFALALVGCLKTEEFPVEPRISLKSMAYLGDSLVVTISFTDGDGDIGLSDDMTQPPFNSGSVYYNNLFYHSEKLVDGVWEDQELPYAYRTKVLTPEGQNKALDGEITIGLAPPIFPVFPIETGDTCRFRIQLYDRALHESNLVYTPAIVAR